jgi:dipeptidyl aminopeptidase/acylaminoacyl peptidase
MNMKLRVVHLAIILVTLSMLSFCQEKVITDPAQITSKDKFDVQQLSVDKLFTTRNIGASTWSPDGKQIAFVSNISGRSNIWLVSSESGWPTQLTVSDQRQISPAWSPNGRWIAYGSDVDGNEQWDIFIVSPGNGQVINLTNTPDISEENFLWSPDSERLAYSVKPKESPNYEIDIMEVATKKVTHLTSNTPADLNNSPAAWSRDGKWLVFNQSNAAGKNANIFLADTATGKSSNLTAHTGDKVYTATDISPNGKTILLTSNAGNGYDNAALLDLASKKVSPLIEDKWEINTGQFSPDGKLLTWVKNADGNSEIVTYDLAKREQRALPLPNGINTLAGSDTAFSGKGPRDLRLLLNHNGPSAPNDIWVYDLTTEKTHQVTHSLSAGVRGEDMVAPFLVHYPSKDGKWQISAFVYVPYNAQRNGKNAAIVSIHGGPDAQFINSFNRNIQFLVNQGFFVIAPNYRGSSGYGKDFSDANLHDMGGGDLEDVISAADWLIKTGFVDPKKAAVLGGSYGGYLSMMAVTKFPDRWAAGVPIVPFVNWFTEIENEDPLLRQYDISTMGDPVKNKTLLQERSPINFVDQIKAPLLLLAGGHDPRCPRTEAEQVASAVKKRGGVVELKVYENEGHGFANIENQIDSYTRIADFLKKYVPPEKCGCNVYD